MMKHLLLGIILFQFGLINAQIENGMIAHFPFSGNYNDISPSTIIGSNTGSIFGPDRNATPNNAIELNGNDYVAFYSDSVKVDLPLTISVWAKLNSFDEFNNIFSSDFEFENYSGYWFQIIPTTGQPAISFGSGIGGANPNNRRTFISDTNLQTGVWYNIIAIVRAHDDMDIYVDCIKTTGAYSGSGATTIAYMPSESRIGSSPGNNSNPSGGFYDGSIDQFVIWNRALTIPEITYICDIDNSLSLPLIEQTPKELVKVVNVMGQEILPVKNTPLIYLYSDGSTERVLIID